ncbi:hypothetical protein MACJ_003128 [Theileria orientalis]|uniref:K Homology domain-containing protein n=1 Tax=Theileria orientalis TaxID=68886 RepID=A0A976M7A7_THEOR|nr:hypothetical protein MACJ_003128 [Theileria orientalis]
MDNTQLPLETLTKSDKVSNQRHHNIFQNSSRDIQDYINEGISNIIISNSDYNLDNIKLFQKDTLDLNTPEETYLNSLLKNDETNKSGLTHIDDTNELRSSIDMFYLNNLGKSDTEPSDFNYMKNLENHLLFFENNIHNIEPNLSYRFGLMENSKSNTLGNSSSSTNYDYNVSSSANSPYIVNNDYSEEKSDKNAKELSYGEHIIYNKIETLQRMIKHMVMTIHEKYNTDSNLRYEAFLNETVNESIYDFTLAQIFSQKNQRRSSLKLLASHGVIGSFFGSNGHRVQALQQEFSVNVSVTTKRIHFPGSNNKGVLLINGKLYNILKVLRPLYRAIQEEVIRLLIDDSVRIEPSKIRLEIEVLIPESLRFTMDRNKHFKQIMEMTGANIRVIKQTYEDGPVQERVLVVFGTQNEVELAIEKIALMIQDDVGFKHYSYMNYPDLTVALNANDFTVRYHQKKSEIDLNKCKKKYSP